MYNWYLSDVTSSLTGNTLRLNATFIFLSMAASSISYAPWNNDLNDEGVRNLAVVK